MAGSEVFVPVPQIPPDTARQVRFRFVRSARRMHDRFSNPFLKQVGKSRSGEQRESERKYPSESSFVREHACGSVAGA
jgi:hypothetical protein